MKAVVLNEYGAPDKLRLEEVPIPSPSTGQVLIKVESASVNYADIVRRRNDPYPLSTPLPSILGGEVASTIEKIGDDVSIELNTRVFAITLNGGLGGYAQYTLANINTVIPIPDELDFDVACTLVVAGITAYQTLKEAGRLQAGESVFIPGASGGVGMYAIQLAKIFGASTQEKRDQALLNGADYAIDYSDVSWPDQVKSLTKGNGADVILEMIGGQLFNQSLTALALFGPLVVYGTASRERSNLVPQLLLGQCQSVVGYYVAAWFGAKQAATLAAFDSLVELILSNRLAVAIDARLPLIDAAKAHATMENRNATGKIVLKPWLET